MLPLDTPYTTPPSSIVSATEDHTSQNPPYEQATMIDCHCHIFTKSCSPFLGVLKNRLAELLSGSAFEVQDKDNIGFILRHWRNYLRELRTSKHSMAEIEKQLFEDSGAELCVPLMMNFDHGYSDSLPPTPYAAQLEEMIQVTRSARGRILPFYAFDPRDSHPGGDPIAGARKAIEEQGFIGIKLYPPLGYAPCNNHDPQLDKALECLYRFCCFEKDGTPRQAPIPITSHCSWCAGAYSNISVTGIGNKKKYYRALAHPRYWHQVLRDFPQLKLNLAHFGGLGEWEARCLNKEPREQWIDSICQLIDRHENVYSDLSFHGLPASGLAESYHRVLLDTIQGLEDKILLGSDWYISEAQCPLPDYWQGFRKMLNPRLFSMMGTDNAVNFLHSDATTTFFPKFFKTRQIHLDSNYRKYFPENSTRGTDHA